MSGQKVYVVVSGAAIDRWDIEAIFLDRRHADQFCEIYADGRDERAADIYVEEHEITTEPPEPYDGSLWEARWWSDGENEEFPVLERHFRGPRPPNAYITFESGWGENAAGHLMSIEGTDRELVVQLRDARVAAIKAAFKADV